MSQMGPDSVVRRWRPTLQTQVGHLPRPEKLPGSDICTAAENMRLIRSVTLEPIEGQSPVKTEDATNSQMQQKLQKGECFWRAITYTSAVAAFIFTGAVGYRVLCGS